MPHVIMVAVLVLLALIFLEGPIERLGEFLKQLTRTVAMIVLVLIVFGSSIIHWDEVKKAGREVAKSYQEFKTAAR